VAEQIPKPAPTPAALPSPPSPPKSELISTHIPLIISIFIRTHTCFVLIISSAYSMYAWQFILAVYSEQKATEALPKPGPIRTGLQ
jgi:hypothetical protein